MQPTEGPQVAPRTARPAASPGRSPQAQAAAKRATLAMRSGLLSSWLAYGRLTELAFPRRFPIVQFPNLPLRIALGAGTAGTFLHGSAHSYLVAVSYLAMTILAYEELVHGVNWFRHLLGMAYTIILIARVAHALHA